MGQAARARRGARRLRHGRAEDPLQGRPCGPQGRRRRSAATFTWRPATTTRKPPASTPTSASSPVTTTSARTPRLVFNYLTGYSNVPTWKTRASSSHRSGCRASMMTKIEQEAENQKRHKNGRIIAEVDGLPNPRWSRPCTERARRVSGSTSSAEASPACTGVPGLGDHPGALPRRSLPRAQPHLLVLAGDDDGGPIH